MYTLSKNTHVGSGRGHGHRPAARRAPGSEGRGSAAGPRCARGPGCGSGCVFGTVMIVFGSIGTDRNLTHIQIYTCTYLRGDRERAPRPPRSRPRLRSGDRSRSRSLRAALGEGAGGCCRCCAALAAVAVVEGGALVGEEDGGGTGTPAAARARAMMASFPVGGWSSAPVGVGAAAVAVESPKREGRCCVLGLLCCGGRLGGWGDE